MRCDGRTEPNSTTSQPPTMILAFLSSRTVQRVLLAIPAAIVLFALIRSAPLDPLMMPGNPPPTYDARDPNALCADLNSAWDNDWPRVIDFLTQARGIDPTNQAVADKLYAAYYNYGQSLTQQGNRAAAVTQFQNALSVNPNGDEARQALLNLTPTPAPSPTKLLPTATNTPPPAPTSRSINSWPRPVRPP